jgi:membrane fusion protein, multidrug efflux system
MFYKCFKTILWVAFIINPIKLIYEPKGCLEMKTEILKKLLLPALAVLILGSAGLWYWYTQLHGYVATDDAIIDGFQSTISSKVLGRVSRLFVQESQPVQAGQLLAQLDDADIQAHQAQDQAAFTSSEENVNLAQVNLNKAQTDFNRAEAQFDKSFISRQEYDNARHALDVAKVTYTIALSAVKSCQAKLGVDQTDLSNLQINTPIAGVVSKRWVLNGDVVQPGQSIFTIYDLKHVWVTANFEETKLGAIRVGDPVEVTVDAYPEARFRGWIKEIGVNTASQFSLIPANNASGNFTKVTQRVPLKIGIANTINAKPLLPGMSVEVKVKVK